MRSDIVVKRRNHCGGVVELVERESNTMKLSWEALNKVHEVAEFEI